MATNLDPDKARAAAVLVPPSSKDDYLKATEESRRGFTRTADSDDPDFGWTVAKGARPDIAELPGQVFDPRQLPDPEVARAAGFAPQRVPEHLIIDAGELHPQGPEPSEVAVLDHREALRARFVELAEERKQAIADAQDEDASPQQGTSKTPAGGSPGEATQADESGQEVADDDDHKGARRGRGSRSSS